MTTLATLKARIADDLARSDLTSQIANEIETAIEFYRTKRFYFNETRDETFSTVASQAIYDTDDDTAIPKFFDIDDIFLVDSSQNYRLRKDDPQGLEYLSDSSATSGRPTRWAWFDKSIRLYPIPDAAYTIRPIGAIEKDSPASDAESGNVWCTDGFELIRCRAKAYLYLHVIGAPEKAAAMVTAEQQALNALRGAGAKRAGLGRLIPTQF